MTEDTQSKHPHRIFSGIQPTGNLTLGNYLGAIRNWVTLQHEFECIYCVVDMHALTVWQDPAALREATRQVAAALIACGVTPAQNDFFILALIHISKLTKPYLIS